MNKDFVLAQLSDPHLSNLHGVSLRDLLNKRALGYLSWRLHRRAEHRSEVLAALLQDLCATRPDHIVVTGDLTHLGLPSEFREAREWLDSLGPPSQVTVIPGNHDAYVATPWECTFAFWSPYMVSDLILDHAAAAGMGDTFPSLRVRGKIALIGLSTARPCTPFMAVGSIGHEQLGKLTEILKQTGRQRLFRIVLIHHPPLPGTVRWRKRLTDDAALRLVLARHGAELVLHGHAHRTSLAETKTTSGTVPVIGVPSASAIGKQPGHRAQYHIYRLTRNPQGWDVRIFARRYSLCEGRFIQRGETLLTLHRLIG